jgi:hypothetical protein
VGNGPGQTFLRVYTFFPRRTLISVGGMARGEEWSRLRDSLGFIHYVQGAL